MAYGLDVEELYYADHNLTDIGILDKYQIDVDLAGDKDFEIVTYNHEIPLGGFWYIPSTEYGGIIRAKTTDSDDEEAVYHGSTWRGILAEHTVNVSDDRDVRYIQGEIDDLVNALLEEAGLDGLFECLEPYVDDTVDTFVDLFEVSRGSTLYDVIWQSARQEHLSYTIEYIDKKVYLLPILSNDFTEYMVYSSVGALAFRMEDNSDVVNHLIMTSVDDNNRKRTIHFYADAEGNLQEYATVPSPVEDSQYILDTSRQVLFGFDEISRYEEVDDSPVMNYVAVATAPANWKRTFGEYYMRDVVNEQEVYNPYEAEEDIDYKPLTVKPKDWDKNYSAYFDRYIDGTEYEYRAVSAESTLDTANKKKIRSVPKDWKTDYGQYYYEYNDGTGLAYANYQGVSKAKYVKLTQKPTDWATNYENYYRHVVLDVDPAEVAREGTTDPITGKTSKSPKPKYVDVAKGKKGKWEKANIGVAGVPKFKNHVYYRKESYTVAPEFLKNKTYAIPTTEVAPAWQTGVYFRQVTTYIPPKFIKGNVYRQATDHYAMMAIEAVEFFDTQKPCQEQTVTMDDFIVNIGDVVGGRDEYTGKEITAEVTNINIKITDGMLQAEYVIGG